MKLDKIMQNTRILTTLACVNSIGQKFEESEMQHIDQSSLIWTQKIIKFKENLQTIKRKTATHYIRKNAEGKIMATLHSKYVQLFKEAGVYDFHFSRLPMPTSHYFCK